MDKLLDTTVFFALILALALVIERILEILKAVYDYFDGRHDWAQRWTRRTRRFRDFLERRIRAFEYVDGGAAAAIIKRFNDRILNEQGAYNGEVIVISADAMRANTVRGVSKTIGILIGIALAYWQGIDLVMLWQHVDKAGGAAVTGLPHHFHVIVSGAALGLGAGPVHKIITSIERAQKKRAAQAKEAGNP